MLQDSTPSAYFDTPTLLLEYTKQQNALMSSNVYSRLSRIFEAAVTHRDILLPNFGQGSSKQNPSVFLPSFFQINRTNIRCMLHTLNLG